MRRVFRESLWRVGCPELPLPLPHRGRGLPRGRGSSVPGTVTEQMDLGSVKGRGRADGCSVSGIRQVPAA